MVEPRVTIGPGDFSPEALTEGLRRAATGAGAVASFTGVMRGEEGRVTRLVLEHYEGFTEREVTRIGRDAIERFSLGALVIHHRVGGVAPGEPIVLVAAAARHRRAAFEGCDYVMDHLKSAAPFWKREEREDGSAWIEPTAQDHADRRRWQD